MPIQTAQTTTGLRPVVSDLNRSAKRKMRDDLFAPVPKKKLIIYGWALAGMFIGSVALFLFLGVSVSSVLRMVGGMFFVCAILLGFGTWLVGGEKTEVRSGTSVTKVPTRLRNAMPFIIGLLVLSQVLRLLALLGSD